MGFEKNFQIIVDEKIHEKGSTTIMRQYKVTFKELSPLNQFLNEKMKKNDSCHNF